MSRQLKILIVEDVPNDAELALRELKRAGIAFDARRVDTAAEYRRELEQFKPELILADFSMPNFDGAEALAIARNHFPDIPFIFVSGSIGEEDAIRAMKQGANDYVMKTNLVRLSAAVERAIQEQRERTARRDAEYALRASELRKSAIFEAALDSIVTIDSQGRVIEFNPAAEKTFGYTREEVLGKELAELVVPPASREAHRRGLKHYNATGEGPILGKRIEVSALRKDGCEFPVELTVVPIRLPDQTLFSAYISDITERKRIEEEVRETRNFLASIFDNIPNMIFVKDAGELRFVRLNPAGEKLIGYSENELLGKNDYDFFPKDQADFFVARDRETLSSGERLFVVEETITAKDGTRKILQTKKLPILGKDGSPRYLLGFSEDITERKEAELRLRESEERFRQVAENIREVFWLTDPSKGEMLYISPTYEAIWGRSRQSLYAVPRAWAEAIHLDDRDRVLKAAQTRQMAGEYVEEYRIVRPDGTMRWIRDRAFPVTDTDGIVIRIAGIAEDITERKEQEHRIARLSRIHTVLSGINSAIVRIRDRQELFKESCRIAVEHGGFSIGWIAIMDHASKTLVPVAQMGLPMDLGGRGDSSNRPAGLVPGGTAEVALREKRPAFDNDIEHGLGEMQSEPGSDTMGVRRAAIRLGAKSVIVLPLYVEG
ncbi:MAG TPA: PAS domain S-box protein, partial [Terriglobia bacterium]|nr:PAS domain S-box protein [Terriglobia bacterium]